LDDNTKMIMQKIGDNCPVMKSLHPDLQVQTTYNWM
jgi:hypothetical protein